MHTYVCMCIYIYIYIVWRVYACLMLLLSCCLTGVVTSRHSLVNTMFGLCLGNLPKLSILTSSRTNVYHISLSIKEYIYIYILLYV